MAIEPNNVRMAVNTAPTLKLINSLSPKAADLDNNANKNTRNPDDIQ